MKFSPLKNTTQWFLVYTLAHLKSVYAGPGGDGPCLRRRWSWWLFAVADRLHRGKAPPGPGPRKVGPRSTGFAAALRRRRTRSPRSGGPHREVSHVAQRRSLSVHGTSVSSRHVVDEPAPFLAPAPGASLRGVCSLAPRDFP